MRELFIVVAIGVGCAAPTPTSMPRSPAASALPLAASSSRAPLSPSASNQSAPSWWHVDVKVVTPAKDASMVPNHGAIDVSQWNFEVAVVEQGALRTMAWGKTARTWARFLAALHRKLHPLFSEAYLRSLGPVPASSQLGVSAPSVELWWRLSRDGIATQIAIVESSGDSEFDIAAVQSVLGALPIEVPTELASSIETTAIRWRFWRDPQVACTTYYAAAYDAPPLERR